MVLRWLRDEFRQTENEAADKLKIDVYDLLSLKASKMGNARFQLKKKCAGTIIHDSAFERDQMLNFMRIVLTLTCISVEDFLGLVRLKRLRVKVCFRLVSKYMIKKISGRIAGRNKGSL